MLRVRDEAARDPEDHEGVHLAVGVVRGEGRLHAERLPAPLAQQVHALARRPEDLEGIEGDVRVLLFLRVDPLDDPVPAQVAEPPFPDLQVVEVLSGENEAPVLHDEERPPDAALVAVQEDLAHVLVEVDVYLRGEEPRPPPVPDLRDQGRRVFMEADEVSVHVHPRRGRLPLHLAGAEVREEELHLFLREPLGHVDHERAVLHEAAVLPLRGLVRAEPPPLRGVQVASLEVGLGPRERARHPAEVAEGGHVRRPVEELADARAAADPVPGRERVE